MPVDSGPSARAGQRMNLTGNQGGTRNVIAGVTKIEQHTDIGGSGVAAVASSGRIDSGGPTFNTSLATPRPFSGYFTISGVTRDSAAAALGGCDVSLINMGARIVEQWTTSDGAGAFSFLVATNSPTRYGVATKTGVAGATIGPLTYVPVV